jgi:hypothetical protein
MYRRFKKSPAVDYRQLEHDRVAESDSLAGKFPHVKSLTVDLTYCRPDDVVKRRQLKYEVNLRNAKSVFLVTCPNFDCAEGDFDLTDKLATAIAKHQTNASGEIFCQGWQPLITTGRARCQSSLQYKFSLTYSSGRG